MLISLGVNMTHVDSPHAASIHFLDDDSLLNVFYVYRPFTLGEDEHDTIRIRGGCEWVHERWWFKLAHVCRRWRNILLGSASYLGLCLVCTYGTPVADMLAHSPPLPLIIDYFNDNDITKKDEKAITLALEQRSRVRRIRLQLHPQILQRLVMSIEEEYPILECLITMAPITTGAVEDGSTALILPETLQAPHLRHLTVVGFTSPIATRLITTAVGLVTLCLTITHTSAYIQPAVLLQRLSFIPQLEVLVIYFSFPVPKFDVERQLMHTPITTHITFPNLRGFWVQGVSAYFEAVFHRITTPRLERLEIIYATQLTFSVPRLLQFMGEIENLRFDRAELEFYSKRVNVSAYPPEAKSFAFHISVACWHLDWQVSSAAQISNSLSQMFSAVENLTLEHKVHSQSSEEHNMVDRTGWHKLLRSFRNVKTLRVDNGLIGELSRCLRLEDGELPLKVLPELQELSYSGGRTAGDVFKSFIGARQSAGRPVTLIPL
jgi:hypothetical protein